MKTLPPTYRRRQKSDTWHYRSDCRWWPVEGYLNSITKPKHGEFCDECRRRAKRDE